MVNSANTNANKVPQVDIQLKFGKDNDINFNFSSRERNWYCSRNQARPDHQTEESERQRPINELSAEDKAKLITQ